MMEPFSVNSSDVRVYTSSISSCCHPEKGRILFATRNIGKGEVVAEQNSSELAALVKRYFDNIEDLRQHLVHIKVCKALYVSLSVTANCDPPG